MECPRSVHVFPILPDNGFSVMCHDVTVENVVDPVTHALDSVCLCNGLRPKTNVQYNLQSVTMQCNTKVFLPLEVSIICLKNGIVFLVRLELDRQDVGVSKR